MEANHRNRLSGRGGKKIKVLNQQGGRWNCGEGRKTTKAEGRYARERSRRKKETAL